MVGQAMSVSIDFSPPEVEIHVTQGDVLREITITLTLEDGSAWNLSSVEDAQVREEQRRSSGLVLTIPASVVGNVVTLGPVSIQARPGLFWWDLEVSDIDGPLTIVGGLFQILEDVTNV